MKPPIIVSVEGDIDLYESVAAAEGGIESPEVEAGAVEAWDAAGRPLEVRVVGVPRRSRWTIEVLPVEFTPSVDVGSALRPVELLRDGLAAAGSPLSGPAGLDDLIDLWRQHVGIVSRRRGGR